MNDPDFQFEDDDIKTALTWFIQKPGFGGVVPKIEIIDFLEEHIHAKYDN
jgi:hypothetical protein